MKNKIIYFIFLTALFAGCNDEAMDRFPLTEIANETYWNTENDLQIYNNDFYDYASSNNMRMLMGHLTSQGGQYALDRMTDNDVASDKYDKAYVRTRAGLINPEVNPASFSWNSTCFEFVRAINIGLANYDKADINQSVIDMYKAEARLFRGWLVADKVSLYGDYPWIEEELNINSPELYAPRTPREDVMEKVFEDLDYACNNLPNKWNISGTPGRLNRWCALLIKSRVCLFEGTWRKYHGGTDPEFWLQEAADAAREVIDNGPYELYSTGDPAHDYNAFFQMTDLSGVDEVMYWRRYMLGEVENRAMVYNYLSNPTKDVVEDYLCTDGLPISLSPQYQGDAVYTDIFENRDPRLRQTVVHPDDFSGYEFSNGQISTVPELWGVSSNGSLTGYHLLKFWNKEQSKSPDKQENSVVILRFGEVLLNYTEAKAELGEITQADLDISINKLRDRVGMPHMDISNIPVDPKYTGDGVPALIVEIRRERRVELFSEGFRFDDLRRWKQGSKMAKKDYGMRWDANCQALYDPDGANTVPSEIFPGTGIEYLCPNKGTDWENPVFEEKHYLWPIPVSALSENPNLGQNPGYD